ncbi:hypothetical protein, partial [Variovorax paradoxus]|uniref:hypothetical protein n=1 Tax=Variovorax paradoxus TaxID=34073 RepID=UPI002789A7E8
MLGQAQISETSAYGQAGRLLCSTIGAGETLKYAWDLRDYDKAGNRTHVGTRLRDQTLSTELAARPVEEDRQRY